MESFGTTAISHPSSTAFFTAASSDQFPGAGADVEDVEPEVTASVADVLLDASADDAPASDVEPDVAADDAAVAEDDAPEEAEADDDEEEPHPARSPAAMAALNNVATISLFM